MSIGNPPRASGVSRRSDVIVGALAMAATLVVVPASVSELRRSLKDREAVAVLGAPAVFDVRGAQIVNAAMFETAHATGRPRADLRLVSVVTSSAEADAALAVWETVRAEALVQRAGMAILVSIGDIPATPVPPEVTVYRVKDLVVFATRTGIRVFPFTLIMAGDDHILSAGPGLPDAEFIREAARRFELEGERALTTFRRVTAETNSSLKSVEMLIGPEVAEP